MTTAPRPAHDDDRDALWRDTSCEPAARVADLIARMTLHEKIAQLGGLWVSACVDGSGVTPHQPNDFVPDDLVWVTAEWSDAIRHGLGQLTRAFGSKPVHPVAGVRALANAQREIVASNRFGIPGVAHEECLAGLHTWGATVYPVPLAWGASFDPQLVRRMAEAIGTGMRTIGVHQGLAPVVDVVRDLRWGRVEETIGEDPYLVGLIGSAYVRGLESAGIVATLKHFAAHSASRAGRNLAPVPMGTREVADVMLVPFEMALRLGGARSVMATYTEIDGIPTIADEELLTGLLRDAWGFDGTVVADYNAISILEQLHRVADGPGDAGAQALTAGVDVELPNANCYGEPLVERVRSGDLDEALVNRALERVLRQKCELGLLDPGWQPTPDILADGRIDTLDLDPPGDRALARTLAEESIVLLANDAGLLPLMSPGKVAVVGPLADDPLALHGCYSFESNVGQAYPDWEMGITVPTVLQALVDELDAESVVHAEGCPVQEEVRSGIAPAAAVAREADVCVLVLGDRSGLFGRGTSGEGSDVQDLRFPGVQQELLDAVLETGVPVVLVMLSGRPYALGGSAERAAAIVQTFFPGEEGATALARVLSGRVSPSGRLPVSVPRDTGGQPGTYLGPPLVHATVESCLDPTPLYPFGHGLSYTTFSYSDLSLPETCPVDGAIEVSCTVANTGGRDGAEVVQLYLSDPVAQVTRPVRQLVGFARVELAAGHRGRVRFQLHADRTSFTGRAGRRIVEPGRVDVHIGGSSAGARLEGSYLLTGRLRETGRDRVLDTPVTVSDLAPDVRRGRQEVGPANKG
ncbi:glycoside hydrolase family 3 N-terminal domain-containing protein [Streptomyces sp. B6B3]|uniref:glycoside hydrolase family 3 N-terminal domain-containing protein n=1 Tax=Streptomyces sp. B6B3 TaxID=3153570 RepID=UPI00325E2D87